MPCKGRNKAIEEGLARFLNLLSQALEDRVSEDCLWASQLPELHMHALIFYIFLLSVNLIITPKPGRSQCSPTSAACLWQAAHSLPSLVVSHRFVHLFFKKRGIYRGKWNVCWGLFSAFCRAVVLPMSYHIPGPSLHQTNRIFAMPQLCNEGNRS